GLTRPGRALGALATAGYGARRMDITIPRAGPADEAVCARLVHDAFKDVSERHGFTSGFATVEVARRVVRVFLGLDAMWSGAAEVNGRVVGSIFYDEGDQIGRAHV